MYGECLDACSENDVLCACDGCGMCAEYVRVVLAIVESNIVKWSKMSDGVRLGRVHVSTYENM